MKFLPCTFETNPRLCQVAHLITAIFTLLGCAVIAWLTVWLAGGSYLTYLLLIYSVLTILNPKVFLYNTRFLIEYFGVPSARFFFLHTMPSLVYIFGKLTLPPAISFRLTLAFLPDEWPAAYREHVASLLFLVTALIFIAFFRYVPARVISTLRAVGRPTSAAEAQAAFDVAIEQSSPEGVAANTAAVTQQAFDAEMTSPPRKSLDKLGT
jgi:hypothetical protein